MSDRQTLRGRKQAAHAAGVSERTISRWIRSGRLAATKPGGKTSAMRVEVRDLFNLLKGK